MPSIINALTASGGGVAITGDATGNLALQTAGNTAVTIDTSQNVGIGITTPQQTLHVNNSSSPRIKLTNATTGTSSSDGSEISIFDADTSLRIINRESANILFGTADTERMRITSGGEVYIAGTTDQGAYNLQVNGTGVWGAGAYVNGSDERIKDNIAPLDSGLDVVAKLNPVTYKYKENWSKDQSTQTGFIAQELLTALDGKNYVDGVVQQGGKYMSVAYQNIIPILTKAIQEQQAMIEELKQEVQALKGVK